MEELANELKSQTFNPDMLPFVIELEGSNAICVRGDSVYEFTKHDGSKIQVTGLVSQNGISFLPMSNELQNDGMFIEQPLLINISNENQNQFVLDEEAVAVPPDDVVPRKEFQEIENFETGVNNEINQFSELENSVSILELVDPMDLGEKSIAQSVIRKHTSRDIVCEVTPNDLLSTFYVNEKSQMERDLESNEMTVLVQEVENYTDKDLAPKRGRPKKEKEIEPPLRKGPFICETCHIKVQTWPQFKQHKLTHAKENKPHACKVCGLSFNVLKNLNLHMCLHNVGNLTCPECNKTFTRFASFKAHLPVHEEEENVFCSECGDEFTNEGQLEQHMQEHRNEWEKESGTTKLENRNLLSCKSCNRIFTNPVSFENHKKDHERLRSQLLALAPKRKRKKFRNSGTSKYGNECSICKKSFPKPSQLIRHVRIHTGEKPFKCSICSAAFSQKGSLQIHMSKHNGYKPHVCSCCSLSFSQRGNLITHVNKVHRIPKEGEETYKCMKCPCSFKKLASLNCHVTRFHIGVKNLEKIRNDSNQSEVDNILKQISEFRTDLPSETDILQQAIRISGLPVSKDDANNEKENAPENSTSQIRIVTIADKSDDGNVKHFTVRQRLEGNVRWHQCNVCQKEFKKPSDLIRHIRIHTREKPFRCNLCFRTFSIKSTLKSHIRTHQSSKFYECKMCGKKVTSSRSLKIHTRSHIGIRPFTCQVCSKAFTTVGQLKTHYSTNAHKSKLENPNSELEPANNNYFFEEPFLIVGDGEFRQQLSRKEKLICRSQNASSSERPYECEYCHLKFRKSSHLKQHKLQHTGEKPFSCVVCQKNFTTNGVLKMHLKTHLGQKDYGCDRCTSKFSTKGSLKRHVQTFHSEERPYMCPYCQKRFKTSVNCRKHIKIHRYDNNQHFFGMKLNEEKNNDNGEDEQFEPEAPGISQTLLADSTGTITLPALSQESLTQESIRELEQTLNQQLFGSGQNPEYTVEMISEKETDFIDTNLEPKQLILNVDDDTSIVQTVFSQGDELQTVSNMSEILPESKEPEYIMETPKLDESLEEHTCDICDKKFQTAEKLKTHKRIHQIRKKFNCELCGWTTMNKSSLRRHANVHSEEKRYQCSECPAKFRLDLHLRRHLKLHETPKEDNSNRGNRRSKGPFREFSEAETEILAAQDARHGASVSEKILIASAAEKLRIEKKQEIQEQEEVRTNLGNDCKYCNKSFKKPSDLIRHIRVHTGERPYQCNQCNKCFTVKSTLSSHLRTHYGAKPVSCHICQSMFAAKSSLKVHMRLHTGAKPFECQICGQRFRTSGHRKNHMLSHTKNKPRTWKKQQLQMLNKIAVALVDDLNNEQAKKDNRKENENEEELQEAFDNGDTGIQNEVANEALLLELNNHNSIVQLLSGERSENEVPADEDENIQQEPVRFEIYTSDGQVYITQQNSNLILCRDENNEVENEKIESSEFYNDKVQMDDNINDEVLKNPNMCKYCGKTFSKKSLVDRHIRVHTGERPYSCEICGKRFSQNNGLEAHLRAHRGDKAFTCPFCDYSCVQKGNLRIHINRTHSSAFFMEDKKGGKVKIVKNNSSLLSDSLLTNPDKSPTCVRTSDLDQVMGELFPQVT